jgi:hypothetical protein
MYQPAADSIHDITETAADNPQKDVFLRISPAEGEKLESKLHTTKSRGQEKQ